MDRTFCMGTYNSSYLDQTRELLVRKLGWDHRKANLAPNNDAINRWVNEFRGDRLFRRKQGSGRPRSVRSGDPPAGGAVCPGRPAKVCKAPGSTSRTEKDLTEHDHAQDLRLHPYRIQVRQKLTPEDRSRRLEMAQWFAELSSTVSVSLTKRSHWRSALLAQRTHERAQRGSPGAPACPTRCWPSHSIRESDSVDRHETWRRSLGHFLPRSKLRLPEVTKGIFF